MTFLERRLVALGCLFALAGSLQAITRTWDGGAKNGLFLDPVNWDGDATPPNSGDLLQAGPNTIGGVPFIGFLNTGNFQTPSFTFTATAITQYTVNAPSSSDFLTLTATGTALQNLSPAARQVFSGIVTTVGAANQTWDGGTQGLVMAQIDLGDNHVLTFNGSGTSSTTRNEITGKIFGTVGTTSGLTKTGLGTLLLNSNEAADYTGATTLSGGKLQLGQANQIPNTSKLVLGGAGTFDTGGFSDTMGALLLSGNATLDLGTGDSDLIFADSHLELWTVGALLNILNYTAGTDSLRFGIDGSALTASQLLQISFNGTAATLNSTGFLIPVPEPGVSAFILAGASLLALRRRRDRRAAA